MREPKGQVARLSTWVRGVHRIPADTSSDSSNQYRPRLSAVRVDSIGSGSQFRLSICTIRGFPVELVNVSMSCDSRPEMAKTNPAERFANLKAHYYQTLADLLERDEIEGLTDETTIAQLASLVYEIDSQGRMKIRVQGRGQGAWHRLAGPRRSIDAGSGQAERAGFHHRTRYATRRSTDHRPRCANR